jgi:hypothetical protein
MPPPDPRPTEPWRRPLFWAELFAVGNVAFLGVDIAMAHAVNAFAEPPEWAPIAFSIAGTLALLAAIVLAGPLPPPADAPGARERLARMLGLAVGWGAIAVGVAGLVFHLEGSFFAEQTLKNLVYTAPFVAPLAYTGVGLLILLNRMTPSDDIAWGRWVCLLAGGGFLGNFVLCLADHAQNGFFHPAEWIGVIAAAFAVGFLLAAIVSPENRPLLRLTALVMLIQVAVGIVGLALHARGNLASPMPTFREKFLYGSPIFAPMLFADLAILALIGLWAMGLVAAPRAGDSAHSADPLAFPTHGKP